MLNCLFWYYDDDGNGGDGKHAAVIVNAPVMP